MSDKRQARRPCWAQAGGWRQVLSETEAGRSRDAFARCSRASGRRSLLPPAGRAKGRARVGIVAATATHCEPMWDASEGRRGSMVTNIVHFPRRPPSHVIQFSGHCAFSVADVQTIRNHFSAHAEPGRATTSRWSVRGSGECVQIDDADGEAMVTFGIQGGTAFTRPAPFADGASSHSARAPSGRCSTGCRTCR